MDNTEQRWLAIFISKCPNCGYPRVESVLLAGAPSDEDLRTLMLGNLECERCHQRYQQPARECHHTTVELTLKSDFQSRT